MLTYTRTLPTSSVSGSRYSPEAINLSSRERITNIKIEAFSFTFYNNSSITYTGNSIISFYAPHGTSYGRIGDTFTFTDTVSPNATVTKSIPELSTDCDFATSFELYWAGNGSYWTSSVPVNYIFTTTFFPIITSASSSGGSVTSISGEKKEGTIINIEATPNSGYIFDRWEATAGAIADIYSPLTTYTVGTSDATITGYFKTTPKVTVTSASGGNGSVSSVSGQKEIGSTISITATPNTGYVFDRWYAQFGYFADEFSSSTTFTVPNVDVTIIGYFKKASSNLKAGRYNGSSYDAVVPMYYNGSSWVECEWKRYNGSGWDNVDTT